MNTTSHHTDTRLGELRKGSKLWHITALHEYLRDQNYKMEAAAEELVRNGKTNEQVWQQLANDLQRGEFPELATVTELYDDTAGNLVAQIEYIRVTHTLKFTEIHRQFRNPDWQVEASLRITPPRLQKMRYIAEKRKADEQQSIADELAKAKAIIGLDAALHPSVREARMRMSSYAANLQRAAEIINKHGGK